MDECYCALCGVCFGIFTDLYQDRVSEDEVAWTEFFRLLRQRPQSAGVDNPVLTVAPSYYLSGVGWGITPGTARAPPPSYDARIFHKESLLEQDNHDHERIVPYRSLYVPVAKSQWSYDISNDDASSDAECEVAFPFHATCWDLFVQQHALLAKEDAGNPDLNVLGRLISSQRLEDEGRGLHPDWAEDYDGPETFWSDGWADHPEPEASNVAGILDSYSQLDYLVKDPSKLSEQAQDLCNEPPVLSSTQSQVSVGIDGGGDGYFSRFPAEILSHLISFLPTRSVRAVRFASRAIARIELGSTFWRSRFVFPNELSNVTVSTQSMDTHNQSSIDWRGLYKQLSSVSPGDEYRKNRQRIQSLNQQLLLKMWSHIDSVKPLESNGASITPGSRCCQKLKIPGAQISSHQSLLFHHLSGSGTIYGISACFSSPNRRPVLRGLALHGDSGSRELGRYKDRRAETIRFERGMLLKSLTAGMTPEGIVGLKCQGIDPHDPHVDKNFILGSFDGELPLGQLMAESNDNIKGLKVEIARDGRIIGLGLLEHDYSSATSSHELKQEPSPNPLWYPTIPPATWTSTIAPSQDTDFTYLHHTTFASDPQMLKHLTHLCVFVDLDPPGIYGIQFHYDDRGPIPAVSPAMGKGVSFMINGTLDETMCAALTFYSERSQSAGLTIFTNKGRRANFSATDTTDDGPLQIHSVDEYTYAAGIVARVVLKDDRALPYQDLGFLCAPGIHKESYSISDFSSDRIYDDNQNVWIENEKPQRDCLFGENVGSQPSHGFVDWILLDQPISRITACLLTGKRNFRGEEAPPTLTGVRFDTDIGFPKLLGRCSSFGPSIELEAADSIIGISIGLQIAERSRTIQELIFISKFGIRKGFNANRLIDDHECQCRHLMRSSTSCELVGFVWSFDLGPAYIGDQGVQGLYRFHENEPEEDFMPIVYPSVTWNKPPPPNLKLRPIPFSKMHGHQFVSSLGTEDNHEAFADHNLIMIKVYFNAFLQGIKFYYANGSSRILGNAVGIEESLELYNERVRAVYITSYVQRLPNMSLARDTMAIAAIRFQLAKNSRHKPMIRDTRRFGSTGIFGPFVNQQRGLWNSEGGGSANWRSCFPPEESCICIESNTSFMGLWAEVLDTHIHRLGVLVSFSNPLADLTFIQPNPENKLQIPFQEEQTPDSWLAKPPPANLERGSLLGHELKPHEYHMWSHTPNQPFEIVVYRHTSPHGIVVVGIEFFTYSVAADPEPASTLLGFRSLWMEHTITLALQEDQKVTGIGVKPNRPSQWRSNEQGLGLESVRIWTSKGLLAANDSDEHSDGWLDDSHGDEEQLEGLEVGFGEFMQAIGLVTSRK